MSPRVQSSFPEDEMSDLKVFEEGNREGFESKIK
jgi:hypothetical protein